MSRQRGQHILRSCESRLLKWEWDRDREACFPGGKIPIPELSNVVRAWLFRDEIGKAHGFMAGFERVAGLDRHLTAGFEFDGVEITAIVWHRGTLQSFAHDSIILSQRYSVKCGVHTSDSEIRHGA
jgi:hypothetical protein